MRFVYPEFLFALFAIAIPIIIHLFNFRRFKKIHFSNVEFLKEVKQTSQAKSKLKHLLILLSRILAITFLVFSFAQPIIPSIHQGSTSKNSVNTIYIDNSFSMETIGEKGSLLNEAKSKATEIVKSHRATDKFLLITNDFTPGDQRQLSNEEMVSCIEEVNISSISRKCSSIYSRSRDALNSSKIENRSIYLVSDFQESTSDILNIEQDSTINTYMVPVETSDIYNLFIDTCWFSSPTHLLYQKEELNVRIKNNSDNDIENIPIKLYINDQIVVPTSFSIKANDESIIVMHYQNKTNGIQQGKIELRDDPVIMDDEFYFSYSINESLNITGVGSSTDDKPLNSFFLTDSIFSFSYHQIGQLDYSSIKKSTLLILSNLENISSGLSQTIEGFLDRGGTLVIFPPKKLNYEDYTEFLATIDINYFTGEDTNKTKVKQINLDHPIYSNVFEKKPDNKINLPIVNHHYLISKNTTSYKHVLLELKNGDPFLVEYKSKKGKVYLFTTSIDDENTNFANHALFVPTLYNIAIHSKRNYPLFHVIGNNSTIEMERLEGNNVYHIKNHLTDIIPRTRNTGNNTTIFVDSDIKTAGNYLLDNGITSMGISYNYNRYESELKSLSNQEIDNMVKSAGLNIAIIDSSLGSIKSAVNDITSGKSYWKYCLALVLLFLACEILLIKIFR